MSPADQPRRIAFLGSPALAVPVLEALVGHGYEVPLVVTRADKRRGRGGELSPSPVKAAAQRLGLAVTDQVDELLEVGADVGVVVAFGRIIKPHVLTQVPLVNLHFSLLPRWRGAAPVERAILAGDHRTGVCLMDVAQELDTGGVYRRAEVEIGPDETLEELRSRLVALGTALLVDALHEGLGPPEPQVGEPTYAAKVDPAELRLDWARSAVELSRVVRLGRAWTTAAGRRLIVWRSRLGDGALEGPPGTLAGTSVATGQGSLELLEVQPEGRGRQAAEAWRRGARVADGEQLGR
ncbi:MAG: methionyl-tRNA formyltransferase [Acidimicrobiia bacterium]|nr:methionyl-tRNA formyltransferase [Acidimicrobiia bacterium]